MNLEGLLFDFGLISLYSTPLSLMQSLYPRLETSFVSTKDITDELVERFIGKKWN